MSLPPKTDLPAEIVQDIRLLEARTEAAAHRARDAAIQAARWKDVSLNLLRKLLPAATSAVETLAGDDLWNLLAAMETLAGDLLPAVPLTAEELEDSLAEMARQIEGQEDDRGPDAADIPDVAKVVLLLIGNGAFHKLELRQVFASWRDRILFDVSPDTLERELNKAVTVLDEWGLIQTRNVKLYIRGAPKLDEVPARVWELTPAGVAEYRRRFGASPLDALASFQAKYKTVEAGFFIRWAKIALEHWNDDPRRPWNYEVVDAVGASDEALARATWARRSYASPDGAEIAYPDLMVRLTQPNQAGGTAVTYAVEVERGFYKAADLKKKWQRAFACYPQHVNGIAVLAPNAKIARSLWSTLMDALDEALAARGWFKVHVVGYTPAEWSRRGLLSPGQLARWVAKSSQDRPEWPKYFSPRRKR